MIVCIVTDRSYVGVTSRGVNRRWTEHLYDARQDRPKMAISRAIAKYGAQNFRIAAICSATSWVDICAVEALLIAQHSTRAPSGYNASDGGEGPFGVVRSADSVERSAAKHRGKPCHPNTRAAAQRTHLGKPKSTEHCAKIAAARTGKPRSEMTKSKIRAAWAAKRSDGQFKTDRPYAHHAKPPAR